MKTSNSVVKRVSAALISSAAVVVFVAGCSSSSDSISKPEDAAPGSCVQLSGTDANNMTVSKVECEGSTELSFFSAGTVAKSANCANDNYSYVTFPGSEAKLCLAVNLTAGNCYQINPENIVDYRRVECGTAPQGKATVYKVASRTDGTTTCGAEQLTVNYDQPKALTYCLEKG